MLPSRFRLLLVLSTTLLPAVAHAAATAPSITAPSRAAMVDADARETAQPGKPRARDARGRYVGKGAKGRKGKSRISALCKDGTFWFGYVRPGACGRHGGVAKWK